MNVFGPDFVYWRDILFGVVAILVTGAAIISVICEAINRWRYRRAMRRKK